MNELVSWLDRFFQDPAFGIEEAAALFGTRKPTDAEEVEVEPTDPRVSAVLLETVRGELRGLRIEPRTPVEAPFELLSSRYGQRQAAPRPHLHAPRVAYYDVTTPAFVGAIFCELTEDERIRLVIARRRKR